MPRWVVADDRSDGEGSSSDSDDEQLVGEGSGGAEQRAVAEERPRVLPPPPKGKLKLSLKGGPLTCHVCGGTGHSAGFVGSKYVDCPRKPCYLCKQPGHTTATCPHKTAPETGCTAAVNLASSSLLAAVRQRERDGSRCRLRLAPPRYAVDAAVLKLHSRRVTALEFPPGAPSLVVSGDKKGQLAVWDFDRVYERTVYSTVHSCLLNALRFLPRGDGMSAATSSSDGSCKVVDVETGCAETLLNLNPGGWVSGVTTEKTWGMLYGMDVVAGGGAVAAGDSIGRVHCLDPRTPGKPAASCTQAHKKGTKVASLHAHPLDPHLMLSAGGDHSARLLDLRMLGGGSACSAAGGCAAEVMEMYHGRAINAAHFSPRGSKVLTTCQDNRLRVWDSVWRLGGPPDREIIHSHDFNRYLTPFRAEWDPKDAGERTLVVGRYISEDFGGTALHPVDVLDAATGRLLAELTDPNLTTICPVNRPHPTRDVIVSGSSRSLFAWRLQRDAGEWEEARGARRRGGGAGSGGGDSDDNGDGDGDGDVPIALRGSANFIFFDADEDQKKKRAAAGSTSGAAANDDCDVPPRGGGRGRGRGAGRGRKRGRG